MPLLACECVTGMPLGEQLGHIYCALTQILTNGSSEAAVLAAYQANRVGIIEDYGGAVAPSGYLLAFGQAISRTTYSALFAVTGTTYGAGNGTTTFNVPDLRGRVSAGQDDMGGTSANRLTGAGFTGGVDGDVLGGVGGAESHATTAGESPSLDTSTIAVDSTGGGPQSNVLLSASLGNPGTAHNNVQPTIILNKIIYTGVA